MPTALEIAYPMRERCVNACCTSVRHPRHIRFTSEEHLWHIGGIHADIAWQSGGLCADRSRTRSGLITDVGWLRSRLPSGRNPVIVRLRHDQVDHGWQHPEQATRIGKRNGVAARRRLRAATAEKRRRGAHVEGVMWIEAVAWSGLALRDEESRPVEARPGTGVPFATLKCSR
jgi:hypothetical protein